LISNFKVLLKLMMLTMTMKKMMATITITLTGDGQSSAFGRCFEAQIEAKIVSS
jgi:hypothetical protein